MYPKPQNIQQTLGKKKIYLETLGCDKNRVDSEIMLSNLKNQGFEITMKPEKAEVIIINTCAFFGRHSCSFSNGGNKEILFESQQKIFYFARRI